MEHFIAGTLTLFGNPVSIMIFIAGLLIGFSRPLVISTRKAPQPGSDRGTVPPGSHPGRSGPTR